MTNDEDLFVKAKAIREYGWSKERYISNYIGRNSRLDEIQATVLRIKLKNLDFCNARRREIAKTYSNYLKDFPVTLPLVRSNASHVFHLYVIRLKNRENLINFLKKRNIFPGIHYPIPIHLQPAYIGRLKTSEKMHNTEKISKEVLSLPIYPELKDEEIKYILDSLSLFFKKK